MPCRTRFHPVSDREITGAKIAGIGAEVNGRIAAIELKRLPRRTWDIAQSSRNLAVKVSGAVLGVAIARPPRHQPVRNRRLPKASHGKPS